MIRQWKRVVWIGSFNRKGNDLFFTHKNIAPYRFKESEKSKAQTEMEQNLCIFFLKKKGDFHVLLNVRVKVMKKPLDSQRQILTHPVFTIKSQLADFNG